MTDADWNDSETLKADLYAILCERNEMATEITDLRAKVERLTAERTNRYWEGRYRDEKADNERLRTALQPDTVSLTWQRGFPSKTGMYLVELEDGEHIVTPYQAEPRWVEADGDWDNKTGWVCLTHSRATVQAWAEIPKSCRVLEPKT